MEMERRVMREMKFDGETRFDGSPNKLVKEEDSSSRAASKAKTGAGKVASKVAGVGKKPAGDVKVRAVCRICAFKGLDPGSCDVCVAKAAAFDRIKAAGGDSIKAAKESASRASRDVLVINVVPSRTAAQEEGEEGKSKPVGIVKKTLVVPEARIQEILADPPLTVLTPLAEDYFEEDPALREPVLALTLNALKGIEQKENILNQYFKKGHAIVELEVDYGQ